MDRKLSLPDFLKVMTSNNVPASKAMGVAGKLSGELCHGRQCTRRGNLLCRYKTHNTPSQLGQLTDGKLKAAGVDDKEVRKLVLAAIRKSGYKSPAAGTLSRGAAQNTSTSSAADPPSASTSTQAEVRARSFSLLCPTSLHKLYACDVYKCCSGPGRSASEMTISASFYLTGPQMMESSMAASSSRRCLMKRCVPYPDAPPLLASSATSSSLRVSTLCADGGRCS